MTARSELQAWEEIDAAGQSLLASTQPWVRQLGRNIMATAAEMLGQVGRGIHKNPPLVVYGNPGLPKVRGSHDTLFKRKDGTLGLDVQGHAFTLSARVYSIAYRHADDHKDYKHEFDAGVSLLAIHARGANDLYLQHRHGKPLWEDF